MLIPNHQRPGEARRQYQLVADRIRAFIAEEGIRSGARLPSERDLALKFGVSRSSLREALLALEIDGYLEIRSGIGVYVGAPDGHEDGAKQAFGDGPADLMHARVVLEGAVITLAAARVTKWGLQRVEDALSEMREAHMGGRKSVDADRRFHLSIAEMSGNLMLEDMVGRLFDGRHSPIAARMSGLAESTHACEAAIAEHEAIYRALKARDPHASLAAMCTHLRASCSRWTGEPLLQGEPRVIGTFKHGPRAPGRSAPL